MTSASTRAVGYLEDALAAVEEALAHGYSAQAAMLAAVDHLQSADRNEAVAIAGLLAAWVATEMRPTMSTDLVEWVAVSTQYFAERQAGR